MDLKALTDGLFDAVSGYIERRVAPLRAKLSEVESREPIHGKDGRDGVDGKDGADGIDGKSIDPAELEAIVQKHVAAIPVPKDGKDGLNGKDGSNGIDGKDGQDGQDGQDGRDAAQLDILEGIDPFKRYHRGTCAVWRGGLVRAYRNTEPTGEDGDIIKAGWHVILNGIAESASIAMEDGGRTLKHALVLTDGRRHESIVKTEMQIYRHIWKPDAEYEIGDCVTRDGSQWTAMDTPEGIPGQPGSKGWILSVKRGTHGRDGVKGEKGDRGSEGRAGKDATQLGPSGGKW